MTKAASEPAETAPGWSHYISAVDFIVDGAPDEYEAAGAKIAQSIKKLKEQRARLLKQSSTIIAHAHAYGLDNVTFTPEDAVGDVSSDLDKICRGIAEVFADSSPSVELAKKCVPSQKRDKSLDARLDAIDELETGFERGLVAVFSEFPELLEECQSELMTMGRLAEATILASAFERIRQHQQKLAVPDSASGSISFNSLLGALGEDEIQGLRSAVVSARNECNKLRKDEERIKKERAAEEERRRAEESRLEAERKKKQEALSAERQKIVGLLRVVNFAVPLSLFFVASALLAVMSGWSAFAVSLCTGFLVVAAGVVAVILAHKKLQPSSELPKFLLAEKEVIVVGVLTAALLVPVLQFLAAILAGIVGFVFGLVLHPLIAAIFPCGSWASFFGFILLGPLAAIAGACLVLAIYYLSLRKPLSQRESFSGRS
jgi:hypothetical protein